MLTNRIHQINTATKLRFADFKNLKSGRDKYSRIKLPVLLESVDPETVEQVKAAFEGNDDHIAKCLRWCLRGLDTDKAIRKVKVDLEVADNAKAAYRASAREYDFFDYD